MTARTDPKSSSRQERDLNQDSIDNDYTLHEEWDQESDRTIDETELRTKPDWLEAIGSDDPTEPIAANIREQWALRGEDDFVSDPTGAADSPDWVDDDYDDEESADTEN